MLAEALIGIKDVGDDLYALLTSALIVLCPSLLAYISMVRNFQVMNRFINCSQISNVTQFIL